MFKLKLVNVYVNTLSQCQAHQHIPQCLVAAVALETPLLAV